MKNTFLYGAIVALVVIVLGLGYSKYAVQQTGTETDTVVATEEVAEAVGTDEDAAENPDPAAIAADAAIGATAEAQEATADTATEETVVTETTDAAGETAVTTDSTAAVATETTDPVTGESTTDTTAVVTETTTEAAPIADVPAETATAPSDEESLLAAPAALQMSVTDMMADRVLGDAAAPVTIVEFASYTCSHCAAFHNNVLPTVKEKLISTGKAKLVLREFPLDKFALKASLLARCAPADKYYDFVEVIFRNQDRWVKSEDPIKSLKQLGSLTGMDDAQMETCLNNTEMESALLKRVTDAQAQYKVSATPTFVFNDGAEKFAGTQTPERFEEVVNQLTR